MAKRILVVSQRYWPENVKITDICEGLVRRGFRVDVLCGQPNYPFGQFFEGYGTFGHRMGKHRDVRMYRSMEIKRDSGSSFRIMLNYLTFPLAGRARLRKLKKNRYDAVMVYQTSPVMQMTLAEKIARRQHIPLVTYAVDIWPQSIYAELDIQNTILRNMFERISASHYLRSDSVIVRSPQEEKHFTGTLHMHPNRIYCIPPGQDSRFDSEVRDMAVMEKYAGSFNILITDKLLNKQDYDTVFEAGRKLINAGVGDIRFIVAGSGRRLTGLRKKADRMGLHDMFFFEDIRDADSIPKFFYISAAFLSCKKMDDGSEILFPEMFADYMSQGKPILSASGGMEKSLVREAGCGYVSDPEDADGLAAIILRLYKCPLDELRKMGENALAYHAEHLDREKNIDQIADILLKTEDDTDDGFIINQNTHIIRTEDI